MSLYRVGTDTIERMLGVEEPAIDGAVREAVREPDAAAVAALDQLLAELRDARTATPGVPPVVSAPTRGSDSSVDERAPGADVSGVGAAAVAGDLVAADDVRAKAVEAAAAIAAEAMKKLPGTDSNAALLSLKTLTTWIPSEALAVYMLGIGLLSDVSPLLVFGLSCGVALLIPPLTAFSQAGRASRRSSAARRGRAPWVVLKGFMGAAAFAVWSAVVPGGVWATWSWAADNQSSVVLVAVALAIVLALLFEGLGRRYDPAPRGATRRSRKRSAAGDVTH